MLAYFKQSLILTALLLVLLGFIYPGVMWGIGRLMPEKTDGSPVYSNGNIVGYKNIGQSFTDDGYFWGRPSAVDYNSSGSAGSNKGPSNPEYLALVQERIDSFLVHNPDITKDQIPSELVTASGSGLDPHITPDAAYIQVFRIAKARNMNEEDLKNLVKESIEAPYLGFIGIERINVLRINLELDGINK